MIQVLAGRLRLLTLGGSLDSSVEGASEMHPGRYVSPSSALSKAF